MNIFLISNMYPSKDDFTFGIFVKNFKDNLVTKGVIISNEALIEGRGKYLGEKLKKYFKFYSDILMQGLRNKDYEIIYVHNISHTSIPVTLLKSFINKPLVVNAHGGDVIPTSKLTKIFHIFTRKMLRKAELIVVPSEYFKEVIIKKFNLKKKKFFISHSGGVNTELFKPLDKLRAKTKFGLRDEFVIGFVSRIDKGKGWDIYLQALKLLREQQKTFRFKGLVAGDGADTIKFLKMIKNYKLDDNVIYKGNIPQKYLADIYNAMDVLVFPTQVEESLGLVGLEAMACGVPVMGTKIGGLEDYIKDGENGFFFKKDDYNELYEKMCLYFYLPEKEKIQMIHYAMETAGNYDMKIVNFKLIDKLEKVVK